MRDFRSGRRELLVTDAKTRVRQNESLADRVQCQGRVVTDPVREGGRGSKRIWPVAEQDLVDHSAQHHLKRMNSEGQQSAQNEGGSTLERAADIHDDESTPSFLPRRRGTVTSCRGDDCSGDQPTDVDNLGSHDTDGHRHRSDGQAGDVGPARVETGGCRRRTGGETDRQVDKPGADPRQELQVKARRVSGSPRSKYHHPCTSNPLTMT